MWNEPTKERLAKIPKLYETEKIPTKDKEIHLHFFLGGSDWFITETDGEDIMFGFCVLNGDLEMAEWGYVSLSELRSIKVGGWLEVDCELEEHWEVRTAKEVELIRKACRWMLDKEEEKEDPKPEIKIEVDIESLMKQALGDNKIELVCHNCGGILICEPDAQNSFCFECNKVVETHNPLIEAGLIQSKI